MARRALIIGINRYESGDFFPELPCCVDDAKAMEQLLGSHWDGAPNYRCTRLSSDRDDVTEANVRAAVRQLVKEAGRDDDLLFYFSGHGMVVDEEGMLVTQDAQPNDAGFPMAELLKRANRSGAGSVLIILDCCHSGAAGTTGEVRDVDQATLAEGVTILSSSSAIGESRAGITNSLFTELVTAALEGGAADVRGHVSEASIYAYVSQALGPWQQRPLFKSYTRRLAPVRRCEPAVSDALLRSLPELFQGPDAPLRLDPGWEVTDESKDPAKVEKFNKLKLLRNGRLLDTEDNLDLYYVALKSKTVRLTRVGGLYWQLAREGMI
jgi:hypothetical protein